MSGAICGAFAGSRFAHTGLRATPRVTAVTFITAHHGRSRHARSSVEGVARSALAICLTRCLAGIVQPCVRHPARGRLICPPAGLPGLPGSAPRSRCEVASALFAKARFGVCRVIPVRQCEDLKVGGWRCGVTPRTDVKPALAKNGRPQERNNLLQIVPAKGDARTQSRLTRLKRNLAMTQTEYLQDQVERAERLATACSTR